MPTITFGARAGTTHANAEDAWLLSAFPDVNLPDEGSADLAVLRLPDLSDIGPGVTVSAAVITLVADSGAPGADEFLVHRVIPTWVIDEVTYNDAADGTPWNTPGADGAGTDRSSGVLCSVAYPGGYETGVDYDSTDNADLIAYVEAVMNGDLPNNGFRIQPPGGVNVCLSESATAAFRPLLTVTYEAGGTDPSITDVDTDEVVLEGQAGVAITGTNMGADETEREFTLRQGSTSVPQVETGSGTATSATLTIGIEQSGADIKFGAATLRVSRDADDEYAEIAITVNPPSGHLYVELDEPDADADNRITAVDDIEAGDQIHARGVGGGSAPAGLHIEDDGTFWFEEGETPAAFGVRVWDASDSTWGAWATQTFSVAETGDLIAAVGLGATFSAKATARASITAGVGAGSADTGDTDSSGAVSVPATVTAIAAAVADAHAAIAAGLTAGESWAGHAATAAVLAAASAFGVAFDAETSAAEDGAVTAGTSAAAAFLAAASTIGSLAPGATIGIVIAAIASSDGGVSAPTQLSLIAAALVSAQAAIAAGVLMGESWAGHADTAASMAAAGIFDAAFVAETQSAQAGAMNAGTQASATFSSAAGALASLTLSTSLAAALTAIANSTASVADVAAQFGASFSAQTQSTQEGAVDAPAGAGAQFGSIAEARALLAAAGSFDAALTAFASTGSEITADVSLGATFARDGVEILPPAKATLRVPPRITTLRIPPRLRRLRTH